MNALANTAIYFVNSFKNNIPALLITLAILWGIQIINAVSGYKLNHLGIYPRQVKGSLGIIFSPWLHGSYSHLFLNSIPLFILANFVLINGWGIFISVTLTIMLVCGLLTWLFARKAYHIGASGIIMGYWSYLLVNAYYQHSMLAIILALVCLYYFSSMLLNIFPNKPTSSWESHLFGLISGVAAAYAAPNVFVHLAQFSFFTNLT